jgi:predicted TPR repeat methyltransferase
MKGENAKAAALYEEALRLNPYNKLAKHALKALQAETVKQSETNEYVEGSYVFDSDLKLYAVSASKMKILNNNSYP